MNTMKVTSLKNCGTIFCVTNGANEAVASDEKDETYENLPSSKINGIFSMCSKVQKFVNKETFKAAEIRVCNLFIDNVLPQFEQNLKKQQKQTNLGSFFEQYRFFVTSPTAK